MLIKTLKIALILSCLTVFGCSGGTDIPNPGDPTPTPTPTTTPGTGDPTPTPTATPGAGDPTSQAPTASFTIKKSALKLTADASAVDTANPDHGTLQVRWDWTNDGTWDTDWSTTKIANYTYEADGTYTVRMELKNSFDQTDSASRTFKISTSNKSPIANFAVNMIQGMTASVDASTSSDVEDETAELMVRWDWDGDGTWDTEYSTTKTAEHLYETCGQYTIKLQVQDLNGTTGTKSITVIASPFTMLNPFFCGDTPYMIKLHFRMINNLTGNPVTLTDQPPLTKNYFSLSEDGVPIDLSETAQFLTLSSNPNRLVLVLDFTGSMADAGGIPPMIEAAKAFIDGQPENCYLSLWAFWERQGGNAEIDDFIRCTPDGKEKIKADLDAFALVQRDQGATQIWDLLNKILDIKFVNLTTDENRTIVFLSDGHDTTSKITVSQLIDKAVNTKAVVIFSVGLALRPTEFPADEPNLKKIAEGTGGTFFTINQVSDLSTVFSQIAQGLLCDWTLSYITLKTTGTHILRTDCNYLGGIGWVTVKFTPTGGDIKKGLLSVKPTLSTTTQTEYTLCADYVPRNISSLKIRVTSASPATLTLFDNNSLCPKSGGWTITPDVAAGNAPPADGWYTISSVSPLEYGVYGKIAKCTVQAGGLPDVTFTLSPIVDQLTQYGDKKFVFSKTDDVTLQVPYLITKVDCVAAQGTPAHADLPSANAKQIITILGRGLTVDDKIIMTIVSIEGAKSVAVVAPTSAAADGTSLTLTVPMLACTGNLYLWEGYQTEKFLLQIVPHITGYSSGKYSGSGFIKGGMQAVVAGTTWIDGGPEATDGIDVTGSNTYFAITSPTGTTTPVYVITEGGTSVTLP